MVLQQRDLAGLTPCPGADSRMANTKVATRVPRQPLADGQVWRMAELNLQIGMVGKLLVHYKLAKPNAVRVPNLVGSISAIEKYLKKNKAVLVDSAPSSVAAGKAVVPKSASAKSKK
jgi:hypothetical protein